MVVVRAANAAALNVTVNGLARADFGSRGQLIELELSSRGFQIIEQSAGAAPTPAALIEASDLTPEVLPTLEVPTEIVIPPTLLPIPTTAGGQAAPVVTEEATVTETGSIASVQDVPVSDTAPESTAVMIQPVASPTPLPILTQATEPASAPAATNTPLVTMIPLPGNVPATLTSTPGTSPEVVATIVIPTMTATPTFTPNSPTAVLPLRMTQSGLQPTKQP